MSDFKTEQDLLRDLSEAVASYEVTPTLDTGIYADGDLLFDTIAISSSIVRELGGSGQIRSVVLLDKDDRGVALDLIFLRSNQSMGTINSAPSMSDTEAEEIIGKAAIATGDYVDVVNAQVALIVDLDLDFKCDDDSKALYVAAITRGGTPTYTAAGFLLKFNVVQRG